MVAVELQQQVHPRQPTQKSWTWVTMPLYQHQDSSESAMKHGILCFEHLGGPQSSLKATIRDKK
jgi:hypothetical protein